MANKPVEELDYQLPTDWKADQIIAPNGADVGLPENYGYNYLMDAVNHLLAAVNAISAAFPGLSVTVDLGSSEAVKGVLPIENGGTGANDADSARSNLRAMGTAGGTFTGTVAFGSDSYTIDTEGNAKFKAVTGAVYND